jgi:hypothetical protein
MRKMIQGVAFASIMLMPGCLRYEVIKPPSQKNKIVQLCKFDFRKKIPLVENLPLPRVLEKKKKEAKLFNH